MGQLHDDTNLTTSELCDRLPEYVCLLLAGCRTMEQWVKDDVVELASDGSVFRIKQQHYELFWRVANEVEKLIAVQGIHPPYSASNFLTILQQARWVAKTLATIPTYKLRVIFPLDTENGSSFYRVIQPVKWLEKLNGVIHAEATTYMKLGMAMGNNFDAVVVPRPSNAIACMMRDVMACGKSVIYETDDLLSDLPNFNPAKMLINPDDRHYALIQRSQGRIVSTEQLAESLQIPENTHVVHNGIDPTLWPLTVPQQPVQNQQPVRILWAGGDTHSGDLRILIDPIRRMIKNYGNRVMFVFVGSLPDTFRDGNDPQRVAQAWQKWVQYAPPVRIWEWPKYLEKAGCHIAVAPLVKHPFNESKSELKALEAWALGIPIVASDVAPYKRAVTNGTDGYLCSNECADWEARLTTLILSPEKRVAMGAAGLETLKTKKYLMPDAILSMERALLKICQGRIGRVECEQAMAKRLREIGQ